MAAAAHGRSTAASRGSAAQGEGKGRRSPEPPQAPGDQDRAARKSGDSCFPFCPRCGQGQTPGAKAKAGTAELEDVARLRGGGGRAGREAGGLSEPPPSLRGPRENGRDTWLYLVQLPDPRELPSLHCFPAPGFPSDPEHAGSTRKVSSSSYNVCPSSPPLAGKTKPQPLWGPEGTLCEVNPVLPPLFHSGNQLLAWRGSWAGDGLGERSTNSRGSWVRDRITPEVHSHDLLNFQDTWLWLNLVPETICPLLFASYFFLCNYPLCLAFLSVAQMLVSQRDKSTQVKKSQQQQKNPTWNVWLSSGNSYCRGWHTLFISTFKKLNK